ncbi:hypothetical protein IFR05_009993 [Cadophora sp. M221]|nr:hypothetical protein IFR05_009993 [Cadophora sp. M221]
MCRGNPWRYSCGHNALYVYVACDYWVKKQDREEFQGECYKCPYCIEDNRNTLHYEYDCDSCRRKRAKKLRRLAVVLANGQKKQRKFERRWEEKKARWARDPTKAGKLVAPPSPGVCDSIKIALRKLAMLLIEPVKSSVDLVLRTQARSAAQQEAINEAYRASEERQVDDFPQRTAPSRTRDDLELGFQDRDAGNAERR